MVSGLLLPSLFLAAALARHPIHAASALLVWSPSSGVAEITVRAFEDDFLAATGPGDGGAPSEAALRYLRTRFRVTGPDGAVLALRLVESRREGAALVFVLRAPAPRGLSGGAVWHGVLTERFADQVNLVRIRQGGTTTTLLFTARDGARRIP
ncbi:MAG: DUF6702 family protein [Gemmatimonadales bacterium]